MSDLIQATTDADFDADVLQASQAVLVDFWAPWCGPCKALTPVLDAVASSFADRVKIVKVNVDENTDTPAKYGVRGIPCLILFKDGNVVANKVGSLTQSQLEAFLNEHSQE